MYISYLSFCLFVLELKNCCMIRYLFKKTLSKKTLCNRNEAIFLRTTVSHFVLTNKSNMHANRTKSSDKIFE